MKRKYSFAVAMLLGVGAAMFSACSSDNDASPASDTIIETPLTTINLSDIEVVDDIELRGRGDGMRWLTLRYPSVDSKGQKIMLSEVVSVPSPNANVNPETDSICRLVIGCHATITSNIESPSYAMTNIGPTSDAYLMALTATGADRRTAVVVPDYQGYGLASETAHPYLCEELTARQVVDGARAARL